MKKTTGFYPRPKVDTSGRAAAGQAGGVLLTATVRVAGLDAGLSSALAPWRPAGATHDPAKVLLGPPRPGGGRSRVHRVPRHRAGRPRHPGLLRALPRRLVRR